MTRRKRYLVFFRYAIAFRGFSRDIYFLVFSWLPIELFGKTCRLNAFFRCRGERLSPAAFNCACVRAARQLLGDRALPTPASHLENRPRLEKQQRPGYSFQRLRRRLLQQIPTRMLALRLEPPTWLVIIHLTEQQSPLLRIPIVRLIHELLEDICPTRWKYRM